MAALLLPQVVGHLKMVICRPWRLTTSQSRKGGSGLASFIIRYHPPGESTQAERGLVRVFPGGEQSSSSMTCKERLTFLVSSSMTTA